MPETDLTGRRVLVVEDDFFHAYDLERAVQEFGAVVLGPVASVKDALDLLDRERPDATVLDINLGGEMSYKVADALVARGLPFLFATGYNQEDLPQRHATVPYLGKPIENRVIVREVGYLLNVRRPIQ